MIVFYLFLVFVIATVTSQPTTMAPPLGNWTLKDSDGYVCMRMSFAAQYTVLTESPPVHVHIDPLTAVVTSNCASPFRELIIDTKYGSPFNDNWKLHLLFFKTSQKYNMTRIYVEWDKDGLQEVDGITDNYLHLSVDVGKSYICSRPFHANIHNKATVDILDINFQPFAEYTSDGGFGPSENCYNPPPSDDNNAVVIALSVVGGVLLMAFVFVLIAVLVYLSRRRRYQSMQ